MSTYQNNYPSTKGISTSRFLRIFLSLRRPGEFPLIDRDSIPGNLESNNDSASISRSILYQSTTQSPSRRERYIRNSNFIAVHLHRTCSLLVELRLLRRARCEGELLVHTCASTCILRVRNVDPDMDPTTYHGPCVRGFAPQLEYVAY